MRTILLLSCLAFCFLIQCSEDDAKTKARTETPLNDFLYNHPGSFTFINDGQTYSVGNKFTVKKSGTVTALGLHSPVPGIFTMNLYEVAEGNVITDLGSTSVEVSFSDFNMFMYWRLDEPVNLAPGKTYCVAYSTNANAKAIDRLDQPGFNLPIESSNSQVSILYGVWGDAASFPMNDQNGSIYMTDIRFTWKP